MHKLAGVTPYAWNKLNQAIKYEKDLNEAMIELGRHFKVDPSDAEALFQLKRKQVPKTKVIFIDEGDKRFSPTYIPSTDTILSYKEPWSFLHEYGHAFEKADVWEKIRRMLPIKHKLSKNQQQLLSEYINEAYMSGDVNSKKIGEFLNKAIKDTQNRKEGDVWRLTEELRANARAYRDSKLLTGRENAEKVLQPLSISDVSYLGDFYPDELSKLLNTERIPVTERIRNLNIYKIIKNKIKKAEYGMPEDWEKIRT